jgi:hypothetical protein
MMRKHGDVSAEIKELTKNLAEQAGKIATNTNNAITKLFSPFSPQCSSFSESIASASSKSPPVNTFQLAREEKVKTERKIICIKEQMDFYKYVLSSEHYDSEEKNKAKEGPIKLMEKLNEMSSANCSYQATHISWCCNL